MLHVNQCNSERFITAVANVAVTKQYDFCIDIAALPSHKPLEIWAYLIDLRIILPANCDITVLVSSWRVMAVLCVGGDTKLPAVDAVSPIAVQPAAAVAAAAAAAAAGQQQPGNVPQAAGSATATQHQQQQQQQSYLNPAAMHPAAAAPAGYSYYYPGASILPVGSYYAPMIQMGGLVSTINIQESKQAKVICESKTYNVIY